MKRPVHVHVPKKVHIDILELDMQSGVHWLHPSKLPQNRAKIEAIRKKHRDKYLAERKARR
jgi:hypothetical protein